MIDAGTTMKELRERFAKTRDNDEIEKYGRIQTGEERKVNEKMEEDRLSREEQELHNREVEQWKENRLSFIPLRFKDKSFGNYKASNKEQIFAVEHLKTGKSAVIYGTNGTGKTHLAFASIRYQIEHEQDAKYILAFDFFNEIKRSFSDGKTESIMREYSRADYLIVDEVDKAFGSQTEFVYLYSLINERYNRMKPSVLITNAGAETLVDVIGSSTLSRVAGDGAIIKLSGDDYRKR